MKLRVITLGLLAACSNSSSSMGNNNPVDAPSGTITDAATGTPDAIVIPPGSILISGTATQQALNGSSALAGATIAAYATTDENTAVATATSGVDGKYSMVIDAKGAALDGFIKATKTGFVDTYLYPPAPLTASFSGADANMIDTTTFGQLSGIIGQTSGNGIIVLEVEDAVTNGKFVAGAAVTSTPPPGKVEYSGANGSPLPAAGTGTMADGRAFLINVPPSTVAAPTVVSAKTTTTTYASHSLKVRAGVLTTTLIVP